MRTALCLFAATVLVSAQSMAQDPAVVSVSCHDCGGIRYHHPACVAQKDVYQKGYAPQHQPQQQPQQGQFMAGPARGPVQGESNGIGITGPALRFPAFTLPLPSLDLPSLFRVRNGAKMLVGPSEAHFVEGPSSQPLNMMMSPTLQRGPAAGPTNQDDGRSSSPTQNSYPTQKITHQSASVDPAITQLLINQQKQLDLLSAQLGQMQDALVNSTERLPDTRMVQRSSYTQPANQVEPGRLPVIGDGMRRLPIAR